MERLDRDQFRALFRAARSAAFHLELKDSYGVVEEDAPFQRFLAGGPDDNAWMEGWFDTVRSAASEGVHVQRARVVSEPLNDYARFLLHISPGNTAAGEDVRYLSRDQVEGIDMPAEDCWLFDDTTLVLVMFHPSGRMDGFYVQDDADLLDQYRTACAQVWERAIPYAEYAVGHHQRP
ncbi:MAG: hypothetical protein L0Y54_23420 [Sporichthyaceae bacterium]|nr:hypothetical protein [Sporichthyaceae bacterium]